MKSQLNNKYLKLAIQKKGRLTDETLEFLHKAGFSFDTSKQKLFSLCRNFPMEIIYVRYEDIPKYVSSGTVDLGIIGQNFLNEDKPLVKKLINLGYGFCSLVVAIPKESDIQSITDLKNCKIASSYPNSTKKYFDEKNIPVEIVPIAGSVEITPALGIAQAIADLVSTGSTLALNDMKVLTKIYDSEAVLIANKESLVNGKKVLLEKLLTRFKAVLSAKDYKYVMMNAPEEVLPKIRKIIPGLNSPTISSLANNGWLSIQTVIKEDVFWETIEKLKKAGASGIIVLPIEKLIV